MTEQPETMSLLAIPIETVEAIIFDAMTSMNKHADVLVPVLNEHKSREVADAYRAGVYAVSMKLGMLIGTDGIERQGARHAKYAAEREEYRERREARHAEIAVEEYLARRESKKENHKTRKPKPKRNKKQWQS